MTAPNEPNSAHPDNPAEPGRINLNALSIEELAQVISAAGKKKVTAEQVQADVDAGAPCGQDGRIDLLRYAAWLAREVNR